MAFLAIPGVDNGEQGAHRSPPQLASYLSVISSIGCVIVGLLLVRQNRTKNLHTSGDAVSPLRASPTRYRYLNWVLGSFPSQDISITSRFRARGPVNHVQLALCTTHVGVSSSASNGGGLCNLRAFAIKKGWFRSW